MTLVDQIQAIRDERDRLKAEEWVHRRQWDEQWDARQKAEAELAALRARVTEFLDVYDRGEDFDALDRAEAALRAEVPRG